MSGRGLTFSRGRAPVGGSQLPLPGGRLRRAYLRKLISGGSHIGSQSEIRTRGHRRCTAQRPDRDGRLGLLPMHQDTVVSILSIVPGLRVGVVVCKNQGTACRPCTHITVTSLYVDKEWKHYGGHSRPSHPKVERLIMSVSYMHCHPISYCTMHVIQIVAE